MPGVVSQCAEKKVKAVVINSAGFAETRTIEGSSLQSQLTQGSRRAGKHRRVRAQLSGLIFDRQPRAALFRRSESDRERSDGGFSGGYFSKRLHANHAVSRRDHLWPDFQPCHFERQRSPFWMCPIIWSICLIDPETKVVGLVLEGIRDADNIRRVAAKAAPVREKGYCGSQDRRVQRARRVFLPIPARSQDPITCRMPSLDNTVGSGRRRSGSTSDDHGSFSSARVVEGRRLAVVGFSGGTTSLSADLCEEMKLALPSLSEQTAAALRAELRGFLSAKNPLDLGGPNPRWVESVQRCIGLLRRKRPV